MDDVLDAIEVLDAGVGHVPLVPEHQAGSDHELRLLVVDAEREIARERVQDARDQQEQHPGFPVAARAPDPTTIGQP